MKPKIRTKWYHGTNQHGLDEIKKQGFLLHKRIVLDKNGNPSKIYKSSPCTYLATNKEEAKKYGNIILEIEYDPTKNPKKNNYKPNSWQIRVYEPIYNYKIVKK